MIWRWLFAVPVLASLLVAPATALTHAIPLHYDAALTADGFPSPLVTLTIGHQRAVFIVDTGAAVHTFAEWFVAASGLHVQASGRTVIGSTGKESAVKAVSSATGALGNGHPLTLQPAIVAGFPPIFEQHRIGVTFTATARCNRRRNCPRSGAAALDLSPRAPIPCGRPRRFRPCMHQRGFSFPQSPIFFGCAC